MKFKMTSLMAPVFSPIFSLALALTTVIASLTLPSVANAYVGISVGIGGHPHPYYHDHFYHPYYYDVGAHRYWHHGYYNGRMGWWWVDGGTYTYYDQPVYPYPQTIIVQQPQPQVPPPAPQPVIIQQPEQVIQEMPSSPANSGAVYYYCRDPQGYYPTVQSCPSGWAASPAPKPR